MIVGTPGRLYEQISKSEKIRKYLKNLEFVVLDEADQLMNDTLYDFTRDILNFLPSSAQVIYSSATIHAKDLEDLEKLQIGGVKKEITRISLHKAVEKAKSISLRYVFMPDILKDCYLLTLLKEYEGNDIIIFFNKCE